MVMPSGLGASYLVINVPRSIEINRCEQNINLLLWNVRAKGCDRLAEFSLAYFRVPVFIPFTE